MGYTASLKQTHIEIIEEWLSWGHFHLCIISFLHFIQIHFKHKKVNSFALSLDTIVNWKANIAV